jgi:hypothetical protein
VPGGRLLRGSGIVFHVIGWSGDYTVDEEMGFCHVGYRMPGGEELQERSYDAPAVMLY